MGRYLTVPLGKPFIIDPAELTASGERTLRRVAALAATTMPPEQFLTALGTAVEIHVSRIIGYLVDLSDVDASQFGRELLAVVEGDLTRTWNDRHAWLNRGFAVQVAGNKPGQRFDTVIEARNSVVHGDGFLSDHQSARSLKQITDLRARYLKELDIGLVAGRLDFSLASTALAHEAARRYVAYLDKEVLANYPAIRRC